MLNEVAYEATHRVKDSAGNPVGYIVDEKFYTEEYLKDNIQFIENLSLMEGKVFLCGGWIGGNFI